MNKTWLEWIGIWGSGKSTVIQKLKREIDNEMVCKTTVDFFKLNKYKRLFFSLINVFKTPIYSYKLFKILVPKYFKGLFLRDKILVSELRSFWYCYSARLFLTFQGGYKLSLWEGEFHLIPFLDLNFKQKEVIVNLLLNLTCAESIKFIVLVTSINNAIKRIEIDQTSGRNVRFTNCQYNYFKKYIVRSLRHQDELISILERRGEKIYKIENPSEISFEQICKN